LKQGGVPDFEGLPPLLFSFLQQFPSGLKEAQVTFILT